VHCVDLLSSCDPTLDHKLRWCGREVLKNIWKWKKKLIFNGHDMGRSVPVLFHPITQYDWYWWAYNTDHSCTYCVKQMMLYIWIQHTWMCITMDEQTRGGDPLLRCLLFLCDNNNYHYCQPARDDAAALRKIRPVPGGDKFY